MFRTPSSWHDFQFSLRKPRRVVRSLDCDKGCLICDTPLKWRRVEPVDPSIECRSQSLGRAPPLALIHRFIHWTNHLETRPCLSPGCSPVREIGGVYQAKRLTSLPAVRTFIPIRVVSANVLSAQVLPSCYCAFRCKSDGYSCFLPYLPDASVVESARPHLPFARCGPVGPGLPDSD